jgi:hypothetical protein
LTPWSARPALAAAAACRTHRADSPRAQAAGPVRRAPRVTPNRCEACPFRAPRRPARRDTVLPRRRAQPGPLRTLAEARRCRAPRAQ